MFLNEKILNERSTKVTGRMFGGTFSVSWVHKDLRVKPFRLFIFRTSLLFTELIMAIQRVKLYFYSRAYERINAKPVL